MESLGTRLVGLTLRKQLRKLRVWLDHTNPYPRFFLRLLIYVIVTVIAGSLVIFYFAEPAFNLFIAPHVSFKVTSTDWEGVAVIWVAEVPLAFLLRYLFGENRTTGLEFDLNAIQALQLAREMEGKEHKIGENPYTHLKIYTADRNWPLGPLAYVINTRRTPQEAYRPTFSITALSHAGIIPPARKFETIREMHDAISKENVVIKTEYGRTKQCIRADLDI